MSSDQSRSICGAIHPKNPQLTCSKKKPCYGEHWSISGNVYWDGRSYSESGSERLYDIRNRMKTQKK